MGVDRPGFYDNVEGWLNRGVWVLAIVLLAWAFINALSQRPDKFAALGGLQKHHWLMILGGLFLVSFLGLFLVVFVYIGIGAAAYYLLETRRGLKDVSEGHW